MLFSVGFCTDTGQKKSAWPGRVDREKGRPPGWPS